MSKQEKILSLLHQFKFTIWWHKTDGLFWVKPRQIYALVESNIIKLNGFATVKGSIIRD